MSKIALITGGSRGLGATLAAFPGEDISGRPPPEITVPFWAWLLGREPLSISGQRFEAQAERWAAAA